MIRNLTAHDWQTDAACVGTDPDAWFPEKGRMDQSRAAMKLCRSCDVRLQCLELAMREHRTTGIWGGTYPRDRYAIGYPAEALTVTPIDRPWVKSLIQQGLSTKEIADIVDCSRDVINTIRREIKEDAA